MAKVKDTNKPEEATGNEILENPALMVTQTEDFFTKNKKLIYIVLGVIVVGVLAFAAVSYLRSSQQEEALGEMYPAEFYLEADSINLMLEGNGNYFGVLQIAEDFSWSKAANLANLYAGVGYMKQGKFEDALKYLDKFSSSDVIVQGRAYCLQGDAHLELEKFDAAIKFYKKAADYYPNKFFTPIYLMKLALAYELSDDYEQAIRIYDEVIEKYPLSQEVNNAKKYKARAEELSTNKDKK